MVAVFTVFLMAIFTSHGQYRFTITEQIVTTTLAPVESIAAKIGYTLRQFSTSAGQLFTVYQDNQNLRAEIEQLRQNDINLTEIMAENARLRAILDYKKAAPQFDFVVAAVIARDPGTWTNIIVINRGSADGLAKDMPVVTPQGLAGNVTEVYAHTAKVQLLLDPRSAVGALVQRPESRVAGIVEGNGTVPMSPRMINLARDADILKGDKIITSGFGGIYPKGLLIGEVVDVVNEAGGLLKYAVLKPSVDFDRLEEVMVIIRSREPVPTIPPAVSSAPGKPKGAVP
ncbi:rod shape-determining protein mrec [Lucifera butyrica]|uniref:Cell shape-determining protein MreC n=1 Tax=Lucifera butyrica TaxID=1351585 RepID=A0A498RCR4_9FIRM|nr:rod shape-determining protein mrec [Lucifera butyrica]